MNGIRRMDAYIHSYMSYITSQERTYMNDIIGLHISIHISFDIHHVIGPHMYE